MVRGGAKWLGEGLKGSGRSRPTPHFRGAYRPRSLDGPPFVHCFVVNTCQYGHVIYVPMEINYYYYLLLTESSTSTGIRVRQGVDNLAVRPFAFRIDALSLHVDGRRLSVYTGAAVHSIGHMRGKRCLQISRCFFLSFFCTPVNQLPGMNT